MSRSKIALIIVAAVIVVVAPIVYIVLFGLQTADAVEAHWMGQKAPVASRVPVPLPDTSISSTPHKTISYFGYELELPWDDVDQQTEKANDTIYITRFLSGSLFRFSVFGPKSFVNELTKDYKIDPDTFRKAYGDMATESDYGFYSRMLAVTPDSIGPFMREQDDSRNLVLLVIKVIATPHCESGIFEIRSGELRGFQFDGAGSKSKLFVDDLYGDDGGIEIWFGQYPNSSTPDITQPEINRVLQSIHKLPSPPAR